MEYVLMHLLCWHLGNFQVCIPVQIDLRCCSEGRKQWCEQMARGIRGASRVVAVIESLSYLLSCHGQRWEKHPGLSDPVQVTRGKA